MNVQGGLIAPLNCADIATQLDQEGYAVRRGLLNDSQVRELGALRGVASADDRPCFGTTGARRRVLFLASVACPRTYSLSRAFPRRSISAGLRSSFHDSNTHTWPKGSRTLAEFAP